MPSDSPFQSTDVKNDFSRDTSDMQKRDLLRSCLSGGLLWQLGLSGECCGTMVHTVSPLAFVSVLRCCPAPAQCGSLLPCSGVLSTASRLLLSLHSQSLSGLLLNNCCPSLAIYVFLFRCKTD